MQCKVSFIYHYSQSLNDLNFSWRSRSKWTQAYLHLKLPMLGGSWCFSKLGLAPVFCNDSGRWEYRPSHFSLASSEIWIPRFSPGGAGTKTSFPLPNIRKLFFFFFSSSSYPCDPATHRASSVHAGLRTVPNHKSTSCQLQQQAEEVPYILPLLHPDPKAHFSHPAPGKG